MVLLLMITRLDMCQTRQWVTRSIGSHKTSSLGVASSVNNTHPTAPWRGVGLVYASVKSSELYITVGRRLSTPTKIKQDSCGCTNTFVSCMTSQSSMADPSKDRDLPEQAKPEPKTAALETNIEDAPDPGEDDLDDLDGAMMIQTHILITTCTLAKTRHDVNQTCSMTFPHHDNSHHKPTSMARSRRTTLPMVF